MRGAAIRRRERGFTLLEIALVLVITSILLAIAVPRLPSIGRTDLEASADRLASTMRYLADESSLRGRIYRLTVELGGSRWDVASLAPFAPPDSQGLSEFREVTGDPLARSTRLPDGIVFEALRDRDGDLHSGTREIWFLPEGVTSGVEVRLAERDGGATSTVVLDAAKGTAWREETEQP